MADDHEIATRATRMIVLFLKSLNMLTTTLMLLVDTKSQKVVFAEVPKDFVDFLFSILSLPVGAFSSLPAVTKSNGNGQLIGCINKLHASIKNLTPDFMLPNYKSEIRIFNSTPIGVDTLDQYLMLYIGSSSVRYKHCSNTTNKQMQCPSSLVAGITIAINCSRCGSPMKVSDEKVHPTEEGYVKEHVTYMVTDDLVVKPMSADALSLLSSLHSASDIKNVVALEIKEIKFGEDEAMKLLRAALESNTVLTDVLLGNGNDDDV